MAAIRLRGVSKVETDGTVSVADVDLDVAEGELVALVGPSGAGKTTVLRLVAGLDSPTTGEIRFDGERVEQLTVAQRGVAMVAQEAGLFPHRTAAGNIEFPLLLQRVPAGERRRRVGAAAGRLHLGRGVLARRPRELSAGHRHLVATGRSLVRTPRVWLVDEPLAQVDQAARRELRAELVRVQREMGVSTIYVTNDQAEAMAVADRLVVMRKGRIEQEGAPLDLYQRPASAFVASFLGTPPMALLPATIEEGSGLRIGRDLLAVDGLEGAPGPVTVGLRAEHVVPASPGTPFTRCLHGTVARVEEHGSHRLLFCRLPQAGEVVARSSGPRPGIGDSIELAVAPSHLHLFDPQTGRRRSSV